MTRVESNKTKIFTKLCGHHFNQIGGSFQLIQNSNLSGNLYSQAIKQVAHHCKAFYEFRESPQDLRIMGCWHSWCDATIIRARERERQRDRETERQRGRGAQKIYQNYRKMHQCSALPPRANSRSSRATQRWSKAPRSLSCCRYHACDMPSDVPTHAANLAAKRTKGSMRKFTCSFSH